jgi:hypothetical protein
MKCPSCGEYSHRIWHGDYKISLLPGYEYFIGDGVCSLKQEYGEKYIIDKFFMDYLDGIIEFEKVKEAIFTNSRHEFMVTATCAKCGFSFTENDSYFTDFPMYKGYYRNIEKEFRNAFLGIFGCSPDFIISQLEYHSTFSLISVMFSPDDLIAQRAFKLRDIRDIIPDEKGGGDISSLLPIIETIAISILSSIAYDILKIGAKKAKGIIKVGNEKLKIASEIMKRKTDIEKYCQSEGIEYHEGIADEAIEKKTEDLLQEYINILNS